MKYKIAVDSCGELTPRLQADPHFESVALTLNIDGYEIIDDETFDQADFLRRVAASPNCPRSACPSPEQYMRAYDCGAEHIYAVTLSSPLSGSYNSALLGRKLFLEEHPEAKIHVFDSRSASVGETLIALKIEEYEQQGLPFEEIVTRVEQFTDEMTTYFVLESLEALRKNGRLSNMKAFVANTLNIKPIMSATKKGEIYQIGQARGVNKALDKMVEQIAQNTKDSENRILGISHCNCPERAKAVQRRVEELMKCRDIFIQDTRGVSSLYASDGGILVII